MLLDHIDTALPVHTLQLVFALALGLIFGVAAQVSRFCLRRAVAGAQRADMSAAAVWITGLAVAVLGMAGAETIGFLEIPDHRFLSPDLPVLAITAGGVLFGAGMVLTRGCVSRLTVLSATGNLRAVFVLAIFAIFAHAALKGALSSVRTALGSVTWSLPDPVLVSSTGGALAIGFGLLAVALYFGARGGARAVDLFLGGLVGLVAVAGWSATSVLLLDEFDPLPVQSAAFTLPWTDTLFWFIASTAIPAGFGVGFIAGVLLGSLTSAILRGEFVLQGFESPVQILRYGAGGTMMGLGGVLAGGCTVGAGLSGGGMLSIAALLALVAIVTGAVAARHVLEPRASLQIT